MSEIIMSEYIVFERYGWYSFWEIESNLNESISNSEISVIEYYKTLTFLKDVKLSINNKWFSQ